MIATDPEQLTLEILSRYEKLRKLDAEDLGEVYIRLIAVPLPPTPVRGLLYDPMAYSSDTFDRNFDRDWNGGEYSCVAMVPTNQGPVLYMTAQLKVLLDLSKTLELNRLRLRVTRSAFCASIECDVLKIEDKTKMIGGYANEVKLTSMQFVGRSCHGGSHLIVPGAPYLTALLQHASAPGDNLFFMEKASDARVAARYGRPWLDEAGTLFPANWDHNTSIDMVLSEGYVGNWRESLNANDITLFEYRDCIGKWAQPCLQRLTRNILTPLGEDNGSITFYTRARADLEKADSAYSTSEIGNPVGEDLSVNSG